MWIYDREQVRSFLIKCEIVQAHACSTVEVHRRAEALKSALCYVSPSAYDALISELARMHNYTHLLNWSFEETEPVELTTTTNHCPVYHTR
jgi:hypothetical protein